MINLSRLDRAIRNAALENGKDYYRIEGEGYSFRGCNQGHRRSTAYPDGKRHEHSDLKLAIGMQYFRTSLFLGETEA